MHRTLILASLPIAAFAFGCSSTPAPVAENGDSTDTTTAGSTSSVTTGGGGGAGGSMGIGGAGGGTSGTGGTGPNAAALGAGMPKVVELNKAVLVNPKVMPITYDGDPMRTDIEAFVPNYAQSTAWTEQTKEYGVESLTPATPQHIATPAVAMMTDAQVTALLDANLGGGSPAWGAPDASTVYAFFFPLGTLVSSDGECCTDYDGYHSAHQVGGVTVSYAIMCQCPGFDGPGVNPLQQLTVVASHEMVEAVTDPFQNPAAYAQTDDAHAVWTYVTGGEVADMCELADTTYWNPPDMNYMVQRTWSNQAAAAGHDPCVGQGTEPYYQTIPVAPDDITIFGNWKTKGTKIAKGTTGTVTLQVFSDEAVGPVHVYVDDYSSVWNGGLKWLDITVPPGSYVSGDTITMSVTVVGEDSMIAGGAAFAITTKPVKATLPSTYYFGLVGP